MCALLMSRFYMVMELVTGLIQAKYDEKVRALDLIAFNFGRAKLRDILLSFIVIGDLLVL
jgi:hypothetical protein